MSAPAFVSGTFYTGNLNWYFQSGGTTLSMRGHATTANGGTITSATACLYNESAFSRTFAATVEVRGGSGAGSSIQAIKFARSFPAERFTCHTLSGFDAVVAPGSLQVVVSYDRFESDNVFLGLPATDSGQIFDVQIGSERPPYATGTQGPILIRGVGIKYTMNENDEPPAPPPPPPPPPAGSCVPDAETACLHHGRFEVNVAWNNNSGTGTGTIMSFGGQRTENIESAFYSFQSPSNFEMGVKMLNACIPLFGNKFWVFISGLTDQGWDVTVRDTVTGAVKTYSNTRGELSRTFADTSAFDC